MPSWRNNAATGRARSCAARGASGGSPHSASWFHGALARIDRDVCPARQAPQRRRPRRARRPPRSQRRDRRHRRRFLSPQGGRTTPEGAQRRAPPPPRRERPPACRGGRHPGSRDAAGVAMDRPRPWNRRVRAEALRGYSLEDVLRSLGYRRDPACAARWRRAGSVVGINGFMFYDHLRGEGGCGAIDLVIHAGRRTVPEALDFLSELPCRDRFPTDRRPRPPCPERHWPAIRRYLVERHGIAEIPRRLVPRPRDLPPRAIPLLKLDRVLLGRPDLAVAPV